MINGRLGMALKWVQHAAAAGEGVSDSDLLERFVSGGDQAAFELLVWRHQRMVHGVCCRVVGDEHDAEDAFQAAFLVLARKGHSVGRGDSLPAWLYKVAYRCALTVRATHARRTRQEQPLALAEEPMTAAASLEAAEQRELRAVLDEELSQLPEAFRAPTVLCYLAGKSVDEAAAQLGCPRGTVASRLARARERLRTRLARRGFGLPAGLAALAMGQHAEAAAVPEELVRATVSLVKLSATERAAALGAAATVAAHVVRAMFLRKLMMSTVAVALAAALFVVGGVTFQTFAQDRSERPAAPAGIGERPGPGAPAAQAAPTEPAGKAAAAPAVQPPPPQNVTEFTGRLEASRVVEIRSQAAGMVENVHIKEGSKVNRGDVLVEIDRRPAQAALEQAQANLSAARAQGNAAMATLERIRKLAERNAVSREEVDDRDAAAKAAWAAMQVAQAKVDQAQLMLEYTRIVAPISGVISRVQTSVGNVITANDNAPVLATLIATNPMGLRFDMDERTFLRYRQLTRTKKIQGIDIRVALATDEKGYPHQAKLVSFASTLDPKTGTIAVHAVLPNPEGLLLPGMFARVQVTMVPPGGKGEKD
jgi:RND family efflux transporter MFP subunit